MDRLKALFEDMNFKRVETLIASGNVIFESAAKDAAALEKKIAASLEKSLGFPAATFLRTDEQLARVLEHEVLGQRGSNTLYVSFLLEQPRKEGLAKLMTYQSKLDTFHVGEREVFWLRKAKGMSDSPFFKVGMEKALGMPATMRNVTTVEKLVLMYPPKGAKRP
jgi:uncharacterized protein (DUF1697 family)